MQPLSNLSHSHWVLGLWNDKGMMKWSEVWQKRMLAYFVLDGNLLDEVDGNLLDEIRLLAIWCNVLSLMATYLMKLLLMKTYWSWWKPTWWVKGEIVGNVIQCINFDETCLMKLLMIYLCVKRKDDVSTVTEERISSKCQKNDKYDVSQSIHGLVKAK